MKIFPILFLSAILLTSPFVISNNVSASSGHGSCEATSLPLLINEMVHNRAYINVHTDSDGDKKNTAIGDLYSGQIRGNVKVDDGSLHDFNATINVASVVNGTHAEPMRAVTEPWTSGTDATFGTGFATFDVKSDHIAWRITMENVDNVVGIHLHNGMKMMVNHIHLYDFVETNLKNPVDYPPSSDSPNGGKTITGKIYAEDLCPGGSGSHSGGHSTHAKCSIETVTELVSLLGSNGTYVNIHTDNDGKTKTNTAEGDLYTPGEARGQIKPNLSTAKHNFTASVSMDNIVFDNGTKRKDKAGNPWSDNPTNPSGGAAHFNVTENKIDYMIMLNNGDGAKMKNIVGLHIHQGHHNQNGHVHLVDIIPTDLRNRQNLGHLSGTITNSDICPSEHSHSTIIDTITMTLSGQVLQPGDYVPVVDYGTTMISGNLFLRLPCNAHSLPGVMPVAGHWDPRENSTQVTQAKLTLIEHLSKAGKTCVYESDVGTPSGHDGGHSHGGSSGGKHDHVHHWEPSDRVTSVGLYNACDRNFVFRTGTGLTFALEDVGEDISTNPYNVTRGPATPINGTLQVSYLNQTMYWNDYVTHFNVTKGDSCDGAGAADDGHDHDHN